MVNFTMGGVRNWCGIERGFFKLETTSRDRENYTTHQTSQLNIGQYYNVNPLLTALMWNVRVGPRGSLHTFRLMYCSVFDTMMK